MTIEMAPHEIVDLGLCGLMQILEFMHRLELDDIQAIRQDAIRFPLEQMFRLVCCDMGHCRKHIRTVRGRPLNTIAMINATFPGFMIDVKVLKIVVKVDGTGAEVATEKSGVCGEDGGHVDMTFSAKGDSEARLPFVEVCDDCSVELTRDVLWGFMTKR